MDPSTSRDDWASKVCKEIVSLASSNTGVAEFFFQNFKIKIGNGERIQLWTDWWFNNISLGNEFPRLFSLSTEKEGSLKNFYQIRGRDNEWHLVFRRSLLAWEEEQVKRLNVLLSEAPNLNQMTEDTCTWIATNSGVFFVASVWKRLETVRGPMLSISKFLWKNSAIPKAKFFSWLVWRGKIKTADFMHRIGVLTVNISSLCVCKAEVESINHVLLLYPVVWKLWSEMVNWWEIKWVTPGSVDVLLQCGLV